MTTRRDREHEARRLSDAIRVEIAAEIRNGRLSAGVSQMVAGRSVGMSHAQFGRIERGVLRAVTVEHLSRACGAIGLKLVVRAYPDGEPVRDAAQIALLGRFRQCVPPAVPWRREVALPIIGDRRAWDVVLTFPGVDVALEAETRLHDLQALERRIALKARDSGLDRVILLVNDTATNRRILDVHRVALRERFPLDGREILRSIRSGLAPAASGIVVL